jgi:hypothetical protein
MNKRNGEEKKKGTFLVHLQGKSQSHETGTLKQF